MNRPEEEPIDVRDAFLDDELRQLLKRSLRSRRGMNLVEIMIVVAIVVILIAVLGAGSFFAYRQFQVSQARLQMDQIATALNSQMFMGGGKLPSSLDEMKCKGGETRGDCLAESVLKDPWGSEFIYEVPGPDGNPFDLVSLGSDQSEGGTGTASDLRYSAK